MGIFRRKKAAVPLAPPAEYEHVRATMPAAPMNSLEAALAEVAAELPEVSAPPFHEPPHASVTDETPPALRRVLDTVEPDRE